MAKHKWSVVALLKRVPESAVLDCSPALGIIQIRPTVANPLHLVTFSTSCHLGVDVFGEVHYTLRDDHPVHRQGIARALNSFVFTFPSLMDVTKQYDAEDGYSRC